MLTRKQNELLYFIHERLLDGGISPSFDEMKDALKLKSKSGIHRLIIGLEERGFIRRLPHRARALEVVRLPDGHRTQMTRAIASPTVRFQPTVVRGDSNSVLPGYVLPGYEVGGNAEAIKLPLYGRIAAGTPIEALRNHTVTVDFPSGLLDAGEHFALQVTGDSMIEAGILDGDTVIIRRCESADSGMVVVALIDDSEVTLKRFRRRGNTIALEPANQTYETRIFGADRIKIQGRLVNLLRQY